MDQQMFWNNLPPSAVETQSLPSSPVFSSDANMPHVDLTCDESSDLSIWTSGGPISNRHLPGEMGNDWASSLTINGSQESRTETQLETTNVLFGSRIEQGLLETTNTLPLENVNLNLSSTQSFSQNSSFPQNLEQNVVRVGRSRQVLEEEQFSLPFVPGSSNSVHVPSLGASSNLPGSSSNGTSVHDRCISRKRKGIEGSSSFFYQGESSSVHPVSSLQISNTPLRIGTNVNAGASHSNTYNATGNGESSHRNCRIRINPPQLVAPPNQWPLSVDNPRPTDLRSTHQAFNQFAPFNQSLDTRAVVTSGNSDAQIPVLPMPALVQNIHPFTVNVASSSRTGSSSRSSASREETNTRNLLQHSSSWSLAPTSQAGTSSQVQPSGPTWIPNQSLHQRVLPEVAGRQLISSSRSGSGQSINIPHQPSGSSNTLQELRNQSAAAVIRSLQQSYARSASGALGDPSSLRSLAAIREGRSRVLSEIRNVLARRGEHIQLEDVLLFNHAVLYGRAVELHDRHRDMRLDVDNMSYEELLALEERIGNVSTGLNDEKILKGLKQRKYISLTEETPSEVEPCCICQENYVEEEDVGRLDCGHDFHTACIKVWLMLKNLCPICKTTGLAK